MNLKHITFIIIGILILFGIGVYSLNLGSFTNSDFTMDKVEVVGDNIQLMPEITQYSGSSLTWGVFKNYASWPSYGSIRNSALLRASNSDKFCSQMGHELGYKYIETQPFDNDYAFKHTYENGGNSYWAERLYTSYEYPTLLWCYDEGSFEIEGSMQLKQPILLSEYYNHFELSSNIPQGVSPYLLVDNSTKLYFENSKLSTEKLPINTQIILGFEFSGDGSNTPQLQNSINLTGTYVSESSTLDSSSNDSKSSEFVQSFKAKSQDFSAGSNPIKYIGNWFFNAGALIESFIKGLFN